VKKKNTNSLTKESVYEIKNKSFIVTPVFRESSKDTLGSVFLNLISSKKLSAKTERA